MKKLSTVALLLALSLLVAAAALKAGAKVGARDDKPAPVALGAVVADFTLPDPDGHEHTLASLKGAKGTVLIFIATR